MARLDKHTQPHANARCGLGWELQLATLIHAHASFRVRRCISSHKRSNASLCVTSVYQAKEQTWIDCMQSIERNVWAVNHVHHSFTSVMPCGSFSGDTLKKI